MSLDYMVLAVVIESVSFSLEKKIKDLMYESMHRDYIYNRSEYIRKLILKRAREQHLIK